MHNPDYFDYFVDPADPWVCPPKCQHRPEGRFPALDHEHCASDGCLLLKGGHLSFTACEDCGRNVHVNCIRRGEKNEPLCFGCDKKRSDAAQAADAIMQDLSEALQRVRQSRAALNGETDRAKLDQCRRLLNDLDCEIFEYESALAPKLMKAVAA